MSKHFTISAIVAAALIASVQAQSGSSKPANADPATSMRKQDPRGNSHKRTDMQPNYVAIGDIVGAKVTMHPGKEERKEAAKDGEVADRPSGEIADLLLDARSGEAKWAVIAFGGILGIGDKTVAVPCSILSWNQADESFRADIDNDRLKALQAFDLDKAREDGLDDSVMVYTRHWQTVVPADASTKERDTAEASSEKSEGAVVISGTSMVAVPQRMLCASEVDDYPVYGRSDEIGSVGTVIFDRANRELAFVVLKQGGVLGIGADQYLVPFGELKLAKKEDDKVFVIDTTKDTVNTQFVKYEAPDEGIVDPAAAKRACDMAGHGSKRTTGNGQ
ncbi:MAG: PRC-barrel domain-containing protein [Planctomycetes bacterium]|nr:PRC-barrel domain-containing protein [Planctomycetota bacterium]